MDLSEDELIKAVARLLSGSEPGVVVGLGDDAAVVEPGAGQLVLTTDLLAEGCEPRVAGECEEEEGSRLEDAVQPAVAE